MALIGARSLLKQGSRGGAHLEASCSARVMNEYYDAGGLQGSLAFSDLYLLQYLRKRHMRHSQRAQTKCQNSLLSHGSRLRDAPRRLGHSRTGGLGRWVGGKES